jgi:hypothetical protein
VTRASRWRTRCGSPPTLAGESSTRPSQARDFEHTDGRSNPGEQWKAPRRNDRILESGGMPSGRTIESWRAVECPPDERSNPGEQWNALRTNDRIQGSSGMLPGRTLESRRASHDRPYRQSNPCAAVECSPDRQSNPGEAVRAPLTNLIASGVGRPDRPGLHSRAGARPLAFHLESSSRRGCFCRLGRCSSTLTHPPNDRCLSAG